MWEGGRGLTTVVVAMAAAVAVPIGGGRSFLERERERERENLGKKSLKKWEGSWKFWEGREKKFGARVNHGKILGENELESERDTHRKVGGKES